MLIAFVMLAAAVQADPGVDARNAGAAPVAKEKKICRSNTETGSMFAKRTCHTQTEWDQLADEGKKSIDRGAVATQQR